MELYLVRHGIAADAGPAGDDASRPLTADGHERMQQAARGLRHLQPAPDVILSSPLTRASQTADLIAAALDRQCQIAPELAPGCDLERLHQLLTRYPQARCPLLVGHEPDLSQLVADLTGGSSVEFKKGALAWIELAQLEPGAGQLRCLLPPALLRRIR